MNTVLLAYISLFTVSAVLCLASVPRALSIQHPGTKEGLVTFLVSVALWSLGYVGYLVAPTNGLKIAFFTLGFVFAFVAVAAWLYFCTAYTGRPPRQLPFRRLLVGIFLLFTGLKLTNSFHHLYFTAEWTTTPFPHLAIQHQLLYWVLLGVSYVVIAVGFFMLLERLYYTGADSRPLLFLIALTGLPAIATILGSEIDWLLPLMYEPPGVALFAVGTLFVYKSRLEAIRLTGGTEKPAIYLDQNGSIRDFNQAAASLFPALEGAVGAPIDTVGSPLETLLTDQAVLTVPGEAERRLYEVSKSSFRSGDMPTGQLLTLTDVTERELYREQLEETTEQLEALNRVVRHDIRNDMNVVLGWAEILEDHVDEDGQEAFDRVVQKSRHVVGLTEVARDFVESLTDDGTAELEPVALSNVIQSELSAVRESYPEAEFHLSDDIPQVSVQANAMLSSVFKNLFENAVSHTDEETPSVTVSATETDAMVHVRVADNGPGVPDDQKSQIFGKGEKRVDSPGTGIGLYLVNMLLDKFGGDVWVEDADPKGAVFVVALQKASSPA